MAGSLGYAIVTGEGGYVISEEDTFTCAHCNSIVFVKPRASASSCGGWCALCAKPICGPCSGKDCTPFERRLEAMEARGRLLAAAASWR